MGDYSQNTENTQTLLDLKSDPFDLFTNWMEEAEVSEPSDANAMVLATSTPDGHPSLRVVLLKGVDRNGFVFYTNKESRKGLELAENPFVSLLFHWKSLRRQIRIEGAVSPVSEQEADLYFASRSRMSRLGAVASDQSRPLENREIFKKRIQEAEERYEGQQVPRPANWSGYRVKPSAFEFWQERPYRLHDRARWTPEANTWSATRLYP